MHNTFGLKSFVSEQKGEGGKLRNKKVWLILVSGMTMMTLQIQPTFAQTGGDCPGGYCTVTLQTAKYLANNSPNIGALQADLNTPSALKQFGQQWTVYYGGVINGGSLGQPFNYFPVYNQPNTGHLGANFDLSWNGQLPKSAEWIQIRTYTTYTSKGKKVTSNIVDSTTSSPFYTPSNFNPFSMHDLSDRMVPTLGTPAETWTGDAFLVSQTGANSMVVYGGEEWGWTASFLRKAAQAPPPSTPITTYDVDATGSTLWGQLIVLGSYDSAGDYNFIVEEGGPSGEVYDFTNATGLTEASQLPPPTCYTYPCNLTGPYTAQLVPTGNPSSGIISFGFEDLGETFSATGTLDPVTTGVPEPSTWTMMLLGFAGLSFAAHRKATRKSGVAFSPA